MRIGDRVLDRAPEVTCAFVVRHAALSRVARRLPRPGKVVLVDD
ncbi:MULTISPECIES: hypothetical protein [unclassified Geodermatophilus]